LKRERERPAIHFEGGVQRFVHCADSLYPFLKLTEISGFGRRKAIPQKRFLLPDQALGLSEAPLRF